MRGVQFIFNTPEGASWLMFASEPMDLVFDKIAMTSIFSAASFSGVIRLAYIPTYNIDSKMMFKSSTGLRRLIYHSDIYPVGGDVSYEFHKSTSLPAVNKASSHAIVTFNFEARSMLKKTA